MATDHHARVRWACRRGMLELDLLLLPYCDEVYNNLSPEEQEQFQLFLTFNDQELFNWLIKREAPRDPVVKMLVERIRHHAYPHV